LLFVVIIICCFTGGIVGCCYGCPGCAWYTHLSKARLLKLRSACSPQGSLIAR
jgi:hypothetical protein